MHDDPDGARVESRQLPIFARDSRAVCADIALAWPEAQRLFDDGLLSFNPATTGALDESREAELTFLGALIAHGGSRPWLRGVLKGLHRPYCYDLRRIFFDWRDRHWRLLPGESDPEAAFFDLLDRLRERRAHEVLRSIRNWLDEALDLAHDRSHTLDHARFGRRACLGGGETNGDAEP